jgi:hypothetical protein
MKKQLGMGLNYVLHLMRLNVKHGRKKTKLVKRVMILLLPH